MILPTHRAPKAPKEVAHEYNCTYSVPENSELRAQPAMDLPHSTVSVE